MKRICCFCQTWASGGVESVLTNIICNMDRSDLEIDLVAEHIHPDSIFTEKLLSCGIRMVELHGAESHVADNLRLFIALLHERKYDVVHLNIYQGLSLLYADAAKKAGVRNIILHSHNAALRKSSTQFLKYCIHWASVFTLAGKGDKIWACSRPAAKFMYSPFLRMRRGYTFIPNGIDVDRFRFDPEVRTRLRRELGLEDKLIIGNVGRMCRQKNQDFLLDVMAKLVQRRKDAVLLLIGDGPDEEALKKKAAALGLGDNVIFYGLTNRVAEIYCAMDVLAMPSRFEGLPVTSVEAQINGLRCLFSDQITDECRICDSARFLPIRDTGCWVEVLSAIRPGDNDRTAGIHGEQFRIENVAKQVKDAWMEN